MIGGSAGIRLEMARLARTKGADLTSRHATPPASTILASSSAPVSPPSTPPTSTSWHGSSTRCSSRSTTSWSPAQVRTTPRLPEIDLPQTRRNVDAHLRLRCRSPGTPREGARRHAAAHQRYQWPPPNAGALITALTAGLPALTRNLALEVAPIPRQPDRSRIRRHTAVSDPARRPARRAPRAAAHHAADRARRRPRRHPRLAVHLSTNTAVHQCNLRHRRRAATPPGG